jgi:hypothetical protein
MSVVEGEKQMRSYKVSSGPKWSRTVEADTTWNAVLKAVGEDVPMDLGVLIEVECVGGDVRYVDTVKVLERLKLPYDGEEF